MWRKGNPGGGRRRLSGRALAVAATAVFILVVGSVVASAAGNGRTAAQEPPGRSKDPEQNVHHDTSGPLRDIAVQPEPDKAKKEMKEDHKLPLPPLGARASDPVLQSTPGQAAAPSLGTSFEGVGQGFTGPAGTFFVNSAPPDTNGAVGPSHYVQIVNQSFAIFNKSGTPIYGPVPTNTLWSGFGGGCQSNNSGDATVVYDRLADRWVFQQFALNVTPYLECVAVSTSGNPTGSYNRYSFQFSDFPDYPKLGVWSDAYYVTVNRFLGGFSFLGPEMCAWDRAKMLAGLPATQQCFTLGTAHGGLLPADLDGSSPPPAGAPNPMVEFGTNSLLLWRFHVDWTTPANSTFTGPTTVPVAAFAPACGGGGACVPQPGTTQRLDVLADRLMYRLAYRNFGDHESLVVNHSIDAGTSVGVRWYELRNPNGTPTVYQQGTYAPDLTYRWMGSAAMDGNGDVALGFSTSSSTVRPGVHYTAHLTTDPLGVMGQGEGVIIDGTGSQTGGLDRWGDYSSLNIDPTDDCTFWFTSEYLTANGSFNWHTRVGNFKLTGCGGAVTPDYSVSATPASRTVTQGQPTSYDVTVTPTGGFAGAVTLDLSGLPSGAAGTFNPNPATSTSTLSVTTIGTTPPGTYPLTITGTSGALTHQTSVTLVVQASAPAPDFVLGALPASRTITRGSSTTYAVSITPVNGFNGSVSLSVVSGLPNKASASFSPNPATSSSTLTVSTNRNTRRGTFTLTIRGTSGSLTHTKTVTLVVQ
jgi:hypothetical protein